MERGFSADDVTNWLTYRERVGEDIAAAVAWYGLISLRKSQGEPACRAFLQAMLDCEVPGDLRGVWHEWRNPLPKVMACEGGLPYEKFMENWLDELKALRLSRAEDLASIPKLNGSVRFKALSAATRIVAFDFTSAPPLPPRSRFTLIHAELPPFDDQVPASVLHREELQYERERSGELPGSYDRGTRFLSTFAVQVERLGCEIISGWTRQEMR